jgi:hypothetical protein
MPDVTRAIVEDLANRRPASPRWEPSGAERFLGPRQKAIVKALAAGSYSLEALMRHLGASNREERQHVHDALARLADRGMVRVTGRRGKVDFSGVLVQLVEASG